MSLSFGFSSICSGLSNRVCNINIGVTANIPVMAYRFVSYSSLIFSLIWVIFYPRVSRVCISVVLNSSKIPGKLRIVLHMVFSIFPTNLDPKVVLHSAQKTEFYKLSRAVIHCAF